MAYHVVCGNCKKPWIHPEIEPYDEGMEEIAEALAQIVLERERLIASRALLKAMIEGDAKLDMRDTNHDDDDENKAKDTSDPRDEITLKVRPGCSGYLIITSLSHQLGCILSFPVSISSSQDILSIHLLSTTSSYFILNRLLHTRHTRPTIPLLTMYSCCLTHLKVKHHKPGEHKSSATNQEEKDDIVLFDDLCRQIREKNQALLSLQEEKLALKQRLEHSYRFVDEGRSFDWPVEIFDSRFSYHWTGSHTYFSLILIISYSHFSVYRTKVYIIVVFKTNVVVVNSQ